MMALTKQYTFRSLVCVFFVLYACLARAEKVPNYFPVVKYKGDYTVIGKIFLDSEFEKYDLNINDPKKNQDSLVVLARARSKTKCNIFRG